MNFLKSLFLIFLTVSVSSCNWFKKTSTPVENTTTVTDTLVATPPFNTDSAYSYIEKQLAFGFRVPNTIAHEKCASYLIQFFKQYADTVYVQKYTVIAFDKTPLKSTNIIASFNPLATNRIMLSAHWDSRPFADQDTVNIHKPIPAANDAGSGVAVLMEIARTMKTQPTQIGIDIVLFDAEDYGQPEDSKLPRVDDSYCLGSQYWAKSPHIANYRADFGINLDMVGAHDAVFMHEQFSATNADWVGQYVWNLADRLGYSSLFVPQLTGAITDDHVYVMRGRKFPCIDIIHYSTPNGFGKHWHTHQDDLNWISKGTLDAVGKTVLQAVYQYNAGKKAI